VFIECNWIAIHEPQPGNQTAIRCRPSPIRFRRNTSYKLPASLCQHFLAWEVMAYLDRIGIHPEAPTELITAHGDDGAVLG
jgi:hypothetical protein